MFPRSGLQYAIKVIFKLIQITTNNCVKVSNVATKNQICALKPIYSSKIVMGLPTVRTVQK